MTAPMAIRSITRRQTHPHPGPPPSRGEGGNAANTSAPQARIIGVSVQEMVRDGVEVIVGVSRDPQY